MIICQFLVNFLAEIEIKEIHLTKMNIDDTYKDLILSEIEKLKEGQENSNLDFIKKNYIFILREKIITKLLLVQIS